MNRGYLTNHLINNDCYPDEDYDVPGVGQLWHNAINGQMCYVPYVDELSVTSYCQIFYELKVDPPLEHGYDSDYAVFTSFRQQLIKSDELIKKDKNDKN